LEHRNLTPGEYMKMADEYDLYKLSIKEQQTLKSYLKNYITGGVKTESD